MTPLLYGELVPWYRLVDPSVDHADEAASYQGALERAASPPAETLLELGAGAGNNAFHLKGRFRCTLTDLSPRMQALSLELNPECAHLLGDMRTLRLGQTFDAILLHDAVMYMASEEDLAAAIQTAFVHTRPGGAAVFAPDYVRETFREGAQLISGTDGARSLRGVEWAWDPDPADDTYVVEYSFLLRDGAEVKAVHDRHVEGLFARATWLRLLTGAGYRAESFPRPLDDETFDECFVCVRP
jgi:trans-aconitate methyltransferase